LPPTKSLVGSEEEMTTSPLSTRTGEAYPSPGSELGVMKTNVSLDILMEMELPVVVRFGSTGMVLGKAPRGEIELLLKLQEILESRVAS
jgi:hypothetical protein